MSKVKIQGNASGTGVVTLTAPNTNTDRTITLPDGDISLGVGIDDNATSTAITIDASENVGIGITNPDAKLQVSGSNEKIRIDNDTSGEAGLEWYRGSTKKAEITWNEGDANWQFKHYRADSNDIYGNIDFLTGSATSPTRALRIQTGGGISFNGDTAAANALDDYEEGTWTPAFASTSVTVNLAKYVKIGSMVNVICYVTIGAAITVNQFSGFPYASTQHYASTIGYGSTNFRGLGIYSGDDGAGGRFSSGLPTGTGNFMINHWYKTT